MSEENFADEVEKAGSPKTAAKKAPAKPPAKKPAAKAKQDDRRWAVLTSIGVAWASFAASALAGTLGLVRFMFPNVLAEPPSQFTTQPRDAFDPGSVTETYKNKFQVWIVNLESEKKLIALSTICTHLGCAPNWLESEQKFKCPCHGSGFKKDGMNFEGPAPRPLERFHIYEISGIVAVDKSKKYQYELNQWGDPDSFIPL